MDKAPLEMSLNHRGFGRTFIAVLVIALTGLACSNREAVSLYERAAKMEAGSDEAGRAVQDLARLSGSEVDSHLLSIAMGDTPKVFTTVRVEAIEAITARGASAEAGTSLSQLLVPHEPLAIRKSAADALLQMQCNEVCVQHVLAYLERVDRGEANGEDLLLAKISEASKARLQESQLALYETLGQVVLGNSGGALQVFIDHYGISTSVPSEFALRLIGQLRFAVACPAMLESKKAYQLSQTLTPSPSLQQSLDSCGCESRI